jgi:hypothetical protein
MKTLIFLLLLCSCGSPLLEGGTYDVEITYVRDTWPIGSKEGEVITTPWEITEDEDRYTLDTGGVEKPVPGKEADGQILFWRQKKWEDCGGELFEVLLTPDDSAISFRGTGVVVVDFCPQVFYTEATFKGDRRGNFLDGE